MILDSSVGSAKIRPPGIPIMVSLSNHRLRANGFFGEHPVGEFPFVLSSLAAQGVSKHERAPTAESRLKDWSTQNLM
jgi:hypothetical protein